MTTHIVAVVLVLMYAYLVDALNHAVKRVSEEEPEVQTWALWLIFCTSCLVLAIAVAWSIQAIYS